MRFLVIYDSLKMLYFINLERKVGNNVNFKIRSKITSGYIALILCLIIGVIVVGFQVNTLQTERNKLMTNTAKVQTLLSTLENHTLNMNRSQRGYIVTGKDSYLDPYREAKANWEDNWNELNVLMEGRPDQQESLDSVKTHITRWIETAGEPSINLKRNNDEAGIKKFYREEVGRSEIQSTMATLGKIRSDEISHLASEAKKLDNVNNKIVFTLSLFLFIAAIVAIFFSSFISKSIANTITGTTAAIRHIAQEKGTFTSRIPITTKDEVRDLAVATNDLLDDLENREWVRSNATQVVKNYQGIDAIKQLTSIFLSQVARITRASYGSLYVRNDKEEKIFEQQASFANSYTKIGRETIALGEGLAGQAALERRVIHLTDTTGYQMISTSLGDMPPKEVIILPITFEEKTIAILELATVNAFEKLDRIFLKEVVSSLGLTINSVLTRMEVVQLLNESRAMSEELQAQTEELQTQSEELQTQSEELQAQTEELTNINEQLEERTREAEEKTAELEITKSDLERNAEELIQSSKYKSEFLANMSHELRTPLNSILILSEMLAENAKAENQEEDEEFARVINSSGKDLLNLINDILDLSKIEAGKLEMIYEEVNINELPLYLKQSFTHFSNDKDVVFNVVKEDDVADVIHTDHKRFQQILKNLLSNAFKFTEHGSVNVHLYNPSLTKEQQRISEQWLAISVTDTGIGIPKEKHELIFESFQQADGATVRKYGGTGLGLSICKEFAQLLGGTITLDSTEGEGSTFTLYIPSLPTGLPNNVEMPAESIFEVPSVEETPDATQTDMPAIVEENFFKNKRVLIVDDDERNIFALEKTLQQHGIIVDSVRNGRECLNFIEKDRHVDVILMDIMMPELDGYDTMQILREDMNIELPIIALTAKAMKSDREKCIAAGATDYISKPLNLEQLFSVLRVWLTTEVM